MQRLEDIAVAVQHAGNNTQLGNALPILHEIADRLQALLEQGEAHIIDLQALPLAPGDRDFLIETLGEGELRADIDALGPTQVRETGIHGVWWITHLNSNAHVMAEFIEVCFLPDILRTQPADVQTALQRLRDRLTDAGERP